MASGWMALLGFAATSTIASQGYRSLLTLNTVPWRTTAPLKAAGVVGATMANLVLFSGVVSMQNGQPITQRIPRSAALLMQAPFLAVISATRGDMKTFFASVGMMAMVPVSMTVVDIVTKINDPNFKNNKASFTTLSLTSNVMSAATAYAMLYGLFAIRNLAMSVV